MAGEIKSCPATHTPLPSEYGAHMTVKARFLAAGLFCRTSSSVRLWWEFKEPKGLKGLPDPQASFFFFFATHKPRVE